jgi:(p)ppGpp synthase/HD superfamily hydrolase
MVWDCNKETRTTMSTQERAIEIAVRAHEGQRDKAGAPYVLHPLRLMLK